MMWDALLRLAILDAAMEPLIEIAGLVAVVVCLVAIFIRNLRD